MEHARGWGGSENAYGALLPAATPIRCPQLEGEGHFSARFPVPWNLGLPSLPSLGLPSDRCHLLPQEGPGHRWGRSWLVAPVPQHLGAGHGSGYRARNGGAASVWWTSGRRLQLSKGWTYCPCLIQLLSPKIAVPWGVTYHHWLGIPRVGRGDSPGPASSQGTMRQSISGWEE